MEGEMPNIDLRALTANLAGRMLKQADAESAAREAGEGVREFGSDVRRGAETVGRGIRGIGEGISEGVGAVPGVLGAFGEGLMGPVTTPGLDPNIMHGSPPIGSVTGPESGQEEMGTVDRFRALRSAQEDAELEREMSGGVSPSTQAEIDRLQAEAARVESGNRWWTPGAGTEDPEAMTRALQSMSPDQARQVLDAISAGKADVGQLSAAVSMWADPRSRVENEGLAIAKSFQQALSANPQMADNPEFMRAYDYLMGQMEGREGYAPARAGLELAMRNVRAPSEALATMGVGPQITMSEASEPEVVTPPPEATAETPPVEQAAAAPAAAETPRERRRREREEREDSDQAARDALAAQGGVLPGGDSAAQGLQAALISEALGPRERAAAPAATATAGPTGPVGITGAPIVPTTSFNPNRADYMQVPTIHGAPMAHVSGVGPGGVPTSQWMPANAPMNWGDPAAARAWQAQVATRGSARHASLLDPMISRLSGPRGEFEKQAHEIAYKAFHQMLSDLQDWSIQASEMDLLAKQAMESVDDDPRVKTAAANVTQSDHIGRLMAQGQILRMLKLADIAEDQAAAQAEAEANAEAIRNFQARGGMVNQDPSGNLMAGFQQGYGSLPENAGIGQRAVGVTQPTAPTEGAPAPFLTPGGLPGT